MSNSGDITLLPREINGRFKKKPADLSQEVSAAQSPAGRINMLSLSGGFAVNSFSYAPGGTPMNPMGFPGYGNVYLGNPVTYRWMLQHPVLRLVRSICIAIIASSTWEYEKVYEDVPDEWLELTKNTFDELRDDLISDFFARGRDFGWASAEILWKVKRGKTIIKRLKYLLPEATSVLQDEHGNPLGLRNRFGYLSGEDAQDIPMPYKAWLYTYDGEADYHYGRSWLENSRETSWKSWLDAATDLKKLTGKITGVTTVIKSPSGTFPGPPDSSGKPTSISYQQNAIDAIKSLASGAAGIWFPSLGLAPDAKGSLDAMKVLAELAGKSLIDIEVMDFGSQSPAITGILSRMQHDEELMFAGGLRSSRVGMEGKHGTKAEADTHTDTGTLNAEQDDRRFARRCQSLVDVNLMANVGDKGEGAIRIKTPSLVDRRTAILKAILLAIINDPAIASEFTRMAPLDKIANTLGIATAQPFDANRVDQSRKDMQKQNKKNQQPEPQGGRPTENK